MMKEQVVSVASGNKDTFLPRKGLPLKLIISLVETDYFTLIVTHHYKEIRCCLFSKCMCVQDEGGVNLHSNCVVDDGKRIT